MPRRFLNLLPEEDALDDPDEEDEADPMVPGDLWVRDLAPPARRRSAGRAVVYSLLATRVASDVRYTSTDSWKRDAIS